MLTAPYPAFQSLSSFDRWLESVGNYVNWKNSKTPVNGKSLFNNLAGEILGFMAHEGKEIQNLKTDFREQFKQTHLLYTPQQMNALFTNKNHIIIQGSYGSGKSILGLRKLEDIVKISPRDIIIYLNFDSTSELHF